MAIDFSLREFFHPAAILRLRFTLARTQWMGEAQLREYQNGQLRRTIRHAVRHVPYFRELFRERGLRAEDIRSAEDLLMLPVQSRVTIQRDEALFHADNIQLYQPVLVRTSGSSGEAFEFYTDRGSNALEFVHYWRHWGWAGYRLGQRFAELGSIHFLRRPYLDGQISDFQRGYGRLLLNSMKLTNANVRDYGARLMQVRPLYLSGLPSALFHFAILLGAAKVALPPLRAVFSSGENLTPEMRGAIESTFQCPLLDCYGHMERTACIAQCPQGSYHVLSDYGVLELTNRRQSAEPGVELADAIGTTLHNRAMPLIRYEIGDIIEVYQHPPRCRCGRNFPVVRAVRGRVASAIVTPEGRVESALFAIPSIVAGIAFLQFVQCDPAALEVRVVRTKAYGADCETALHRCLREALGPLMQVRIRYVSLEETERDRSGKRPVIISDLKSQAAARHA